MRWVGSNNNYTRPGSNIVHVVTFSQGSSITCQATHIKQITHFSALKFGTNLTHFVKEFQSVFRVYINAFI